MTQVNLTNGFSKFEDIQFTEEDFKKDWSHIETEGVKAILDALLKENLGCMVDSADYLQLAYTSSSRFTGFQVCNAKINVEGFELNTFVIRNNNQLIAHCFDEEENDIFFEVE